MKTKSKILGLALASALLTTSAFSQVTVSGYVETGFIFGNRDADENNGAGNGNPVNSTKSIGNESVIRIAGAGKLPTGQNASYYIQVDSDDAGITAERGFDIGITPTVSFVYGFDRVMGSEIARTLTPFATTRIADTTGTLATSDFQDVTSGEHAIGLNLVDLLGKGSTIAVAYAPNMDAANGASSDRLVNASTQSGYGIGVRLTPVAGLTVGAGYTKADSKVVANEDLKSKTLGFTYAMGQFAIGAQTIRTDGQKAALNEPGAKDKINIYSATYAATKEITLGYAHSKMDRERDLDLLPPGDGHGPDAKVNTFSIAYNLGPVVLSLDHERAENIPFTIADHTEAGNDTNLTKAKVRVAF